MNAPTVLNVALDGLDVATAATQRAVLASVPDRFRLSEHRTAEVAVISGRQVDWPGEVARAVEAGIRAVVVVRPWLVDPDLVRELSRAVAGRAMVAVDSPYATDRALAADRGRVAADAAVASIVDSVVTVPGGGSADDLGGALLDQLAVVRPLLGSPATIRTVYRDGRQYLLVAQTAGPRVTLTGMMSGTHRTALDVDVVATSRRWQVRFDDGALARPTRITLHDATGARSRPLVYESGRRVTWERLHEALTGAGTVAYSLDQVADDLDAVRRIAPST